MSASATHGCILIFLLEDYSAGGSKDEDHNCSRLPRKRSYTHAALFNVPSIVLHLRRASPSRPRRRTRLGLPRHAALITTARSRAPALRLVFHRPLFPLPWTPPPELSGSDGHHVVFAIAVLNIKQDWHEEVALFERPRAPLRRFDRQDIHVFVLLFLDPLLHLLNRPDVKLVVPLNVLHVFFDLAEIRRERGPPLRRDDAPCVDPAVFEADPGE